MSIASGVTAIAKTASLKKSRLEGERIGVVVMNAHGGEPYRLGFTNGYVYSSYAI